MLVKITQDGIGRLSKNNAPQGINGLITKDLQICIAIILVGKNNISLMHDTGRINLDGKNSLQSEIEYTDPEHIYICFNKKIADKDEKYKTAIKINIKRVMDYLLYKNYVNKVKIYSLEKTYKRNIQGESFDCAGMAVFLDGSINQNIMDDFLSCDKELVRNKLNENNNFFLDDGKTLPGDLQYNEIGYTPFPSLNKSKKEILDYVENNFEFFISIDNILPADMLLSYFMLSSELYDDYLQIPNGKERDQFILDKLYQNKEDSLVQIYFEIKRQVNIKLIMRRGIPDSAVFYPGNFKLPSIS